MSASEPPKAFPAGDTHIELRVVNDCLEYRLCGHGDWRHLIKLLAVRGEA